MKSFKSICQKKLLCSACLSKSSEVHRAIWRQTYEGVPQAGKGCNFVQLTIKEVQIKKITAKKPGCNCGRSSRNSK